MKYLPQLDGLRALAILMVFVHHLFTVPLLWTGVDLFFILSGYLITSILLRDSERMSFGSMLRHFYIRRAERILPAYIAVLLLVTVWFSMEWRHIWIYYALFLQNVGFANGQLDSGPLVPLWSLAVEQQFYLVWPAIVFFLPRRWLAPSMVALLFGVPVLRGFCTHLFPTPSAIYVLTPFRIDAMAAGALAAIVLPRCNPTKAKWFAGLSMTLGSIAYLLLSVHPWFRRTANTVSFNLLAYSLNILVLGGLFVWVVLSRDTFLTKILSSPPARGLGRISYMFYLVHLAVKDEVHVSLGRLHIPITKVTEPLAAFVCTVAVATLSWFLLEKPILSLSASHRRAAPRAPAAAA